MLLLLNSVDLWNTILNYLPSRNLTGLKDLLVGVCEEKQVLFDIR